MASNCVHTHDIVCMYVRMYDIVFMYVPNRIPFKLKVFCSLNSMDTLCTALQVGWDSEG